MKANLIFEYNSEYMKVIFKNKELLRQSESTKMTLNIGCEFHYAVFPQSSLTTYIIASDYWGNIYLTITDTFFSLYSGDTGESYQLEGANEILLHKALPEIRHFVNQITPPVTVDVNRLIFKNSCKYIII